MATKRKPVKRKKPKGKRSNVIHTRMGKNKFQFSTGGYTLIELLIVMIIIAILSVVIFVSMTASISDANESTLGNLRARINAALGGESGLYIPPIYDDESEDTTTTVADSDTTTIPSTSTISYTTSTIPGLDPDRDCTMLCFAENYLFGGYAWDYGADSCALYEEWITDGCCCYTTPGGPTTTIPTTTSLGGITPCETACEDYYGSFTAWECSDETCPNIGWNEAPSGNEWCMATGQMQYCCCDGH